MSTRDWRAVREGDTHAAVKTSHNRTPESFIVGVGASGILLAGAAITFVTLVGLVSFNVWPAPQGVSNDANIELGAATAKVAAPPPATAPVGGAPAQLASAVVPTGVGGGGPGGAAPGGGSQPGGGGGGGHHGGAPRAGTVPVPPTLPTSPGNGQGNANGQGNGNGPHGPNSSQGSGSGSGGPVSAGKQEVHPTHPHQAEAAQAGNSNGSDIGGGPPGQSGKHPGGPPGLNKHGGGTSTPPGHSWDSSGHGRGQGPRGPKH